MSHPRRTPIHCPGTTAASRTSLVPSRIAATAGAVLGVLAALMFTLHTLFTLSGGGHESRSQKGCTVMAEKAGVIDLTKNAPAGSSDQSGVQTVTLRALTYDPASGRITFEGIVPKGIAQSHYINGKDVPTYGLRIAFAPFSLPETGALKSGRQLGWLGFSGSSVPVRKGGAAS